MHCSKVSESPPARSVMVPASTAEVDTEIAPSRARTPRFWAVRWISRDNSAEIVLISTRIVSGFAVDHTPSASKYTERTAASLARQERITSESDTISERDVATATPDLLISCAGSGLRF